MASWVLIGLLATVIALIGYLALMIDSGVSDRRKGIILCALFVLCGGIVGVFLMVEDKTEFVYSGVPDMPAKAKKKKAAAPSEDDGPMTGVEETAGSGGAALADAASDQTGKVGDAGTPPPFQDCEICPQMVPVKVEADAADLLSRPGAPADSDHQPKLPPRYSIGRFEITVAQFAAFIDETSYRPSATCSIGGDPQRAGTYRNPGFPQMPDHPAVCVNWHDAATYVAWLRRRTGKPYRLPTEAEWEYAARAGSPGLYATGFDITPAQATFDPRRHERPQGTTSVGTWRPNGHGLYDVHGNAFELTADCWIAPHEVASADKHAPPVDGCARRVMKGGAWYSSAAQLTFTARYGHTAEAATNGVGFRVARD